MKKKDLLFIVIIIGVIALVGYCARKGATKVASEQAADTTRIVTRPDTVVINDDDLRQDVRTIKALVIHCSASGEDQSVSVDSVDYEHRLRGFKRIGYHFYITRDGEIHKGREVSARGAHVKGNNANTIGICYEGGLRQVGKVKGMEGIKVPDYLRNARYAIFEKFVEGKKITVTVIHGKAYVAADTRTDAQKRSLTALISHLKAIYPNAKIRGHRDYSPDTNHNGRLDEKEWLKACPSFDVRSEYED